MITLKLNISLSQLCASGQPLTWSCLMLVSDGDWFWEGWAAFTESTLQSDTFIFCHPQPSEFPFRLKCSIYSSKRGVSGNCVGSVYWAGVKGKHVANSAGKMEYFITILPHHEKWIGFGCCGSEVLNPQLITYQQSILNINKWFNCHGWLFLSTTFFCQPQKPGRNPA